MVRVRGHVARAVALPAGAQWVCWASWPVVGLAAVAASALPLPLASAWPWAATCWLMIWVLVGGPTRALLFHTSIGLAVALVVHGAWWFARLGYVPWGEANYFLRAGASALVLTASGHVVWRAVRAIPPAVVRTYVQSFIAPASRASE